MKIKKSLLKKLSIEFFYLKKTKLDKLEKIDFNKTAINSKKNNAENFHRPISKCF